ncbi:M13 family metallopeptidase [Zhouia sp. PK063]|uniref:M13 family metallopeptidase n=1 Tax=Zhouia sp. PK063 TaxID=3373602 RepID=UPI00378841B5
MKTKLIKPLAVGVLASATILACKESKKEDTAEATVPGINLKYMDTTETPQNNFFRYVNGVWLDSTEIPADKTVWGSFNELRDQTDADVLKLLKDAANSDSLNPNSDQAKAVNLYKTIMDVDARNEQGVAPLKPFLAKIDAIKNTQDLENYLIEMEPYGGAGFFGFGVGADAKDSNKNVAYLGAGALGLPDRDYYVEDTDDSKKIREEYKVHIARMLQFINVSEDNAKKQADQVLDFETKLAEPRMDKVERRDPSKRYNPTAVADVQKMVPEINWQEYLNGIGAKTVDTLIVGDVKYFKTLGGDVLKNTSVDDWKAYLRWTALNHAAGMLTDSIEKADWDFYSKTLRGAKEQEPREKRALQTVNGAVGEALGKLYVAAKFPPEAKQKAEEMIQNIIKAYEVRIHALPWMDEKTKEKAIEKLNKLTIKVGYPNKWKDYSSLDIKTYADGGSYIQNMLNAAHFNYEKDINKLGKPVDKTEWYMSPQTVNAYYNPSYNEIVFPAAIMQPPFFNFKADAAVNYGGMGAVIGHEISHGFDDSGARYDADGNLKNWWTDQDLKQFNSLGDSLAAEYSRIEVLPGVHINGKFTLGENIGDLGGVNAAYDALQIYLKEHGNPGKIDGFTPEQRFFLSWATVWRTKMRDEALKNRIKTDPHSPGMYRATQPIQNMDAFYSAFNIKQGDSMYLAPEKRVKIW